MWNTPASWIKMFSAVSKAIAEKHVQIMSAFWAHIVSQFEVEPKRIIRVHAHNLPVHHPGIFCACFYFNSIEARFLPDNKRNGEAKCHGFHI